MSVVVSGLFQAVRECCQKAGLESAPHTVEYSLGVWGRRELLPEDEAMQLSTMCGHGMVSANFTTKMIAYVKEDRVTPEKAAGYMAKFCVCGVFNTTRAIRILNEVRTSN